MDGRGVFPGKTRQWLEARCFDAAAAKGMSDIGITPQEAARTYGRDTIGYAVANMDLTITQAREFLDQL